MITCKRCGLPATRAERVKWFTGQYYCIDLDECDRRCRNELTDREFLLLVYQTEITL